MKAALLALLLLVAGAAAAVEPGERLADPALEARARSLSAGLRCLVCQNESIDESGAGLAHDIRILLRERLRAGDSDAQAVQAIVDRYGDFVLLNPPLRPATWLLWFSPLLLLAGGGAILLAARRGRTPPPTPLSAAEQARLATLLQETDP